MKGLCSDLVRFPQNSYSAICEQLPPGVWVPEGSGLSAARAFLTLCRFMEFEAEEMQIQNTQLMNGSQGLPPVAPPTLDPPGPLAPEVCQQPGKATQFQQEP